MNSWVVVRQNSHRSWISAYLLSEGVGEAVAGRFTLWTPGREVWVQDQAWSLCWVWARLHIITVPISTQDTDVYNRTVRMASRNTVAEVTWRLTGIPFRKRQSYPGRPMLRKPYVISLNKLGHRLEWRPSLYLPELTLILLEYILFETLGKSDNWII